MGLLEEVCHWAWRFQQTCQFEVALLASFMYLLAIYMSSLKKELFKCFDVFERDICFNCVTLCARLDVGFSNTFFHFAGCLVCVCVWGGSPLVYVHF